MFVCFLLVLARLNFFTASDSEALALEVFAEYVALVRRLQVTYSLEPVGSHGCLSLFVFQFFSTLIFFVTSLYEIKCRLHTGSSPLARTGAGA
jgi:hypothetical protein